MAYTDQFKKLLEEFRSLNITTEEEPITITRYGRIAEHAFLGYTLPDDVDFNFESVPYMAFQPAFQKMSGIQPEGYDPSNPSEGCNKEFFEAVQSFMKAGKKELQYFISIGTEMDLWHGADAVFSWRNVTVTIDVTVDPAKVEKFKRRDFLHQNRDCLSQAEFDELNILETEVKADFCIHFPFVVDNGEVYSSIAKSISRLLICKYLGKLGFEEPCKRFSQSG